MKMAVMAKEASAVGTETRLPSTTPETLASAQVVMEQRLTTVARATSQPPFWNCARFTPKLSSVTVAENRKAKRLLQPVQYCESDAL